MSKRPEITKSLSLSLEKYINPNNDTRIYMAKEVTFDHATGHSVRVDYMRFKPVNNSISGIEKGDFYCYEIKSSVEDFHSKNGHNFIGDYNYYVMPEDVYEKIKKEIPWEVGVFVSSMEEHQELLELKQVKNARRRNRTKSLAEMLLMMFRSAARTNFAKDISEIALNQFQADLISNAEYNWCEAQVKMLKALVKSTYQGSEYADTYDTLFQ